MADSQNSEAAAERRAEAMIKACDTCRHKKIRCNKQSPCSNCQRTGLTCITSPRVLRPKRRPQGPPNYDGRISSIDERLDRMSQVLETLVADDTRSRRSTTSLEDANTSFNHSSTLPPTPLKDNVPVQHDLPFRQNRSGRLSFTNHNSGSEPKHKEPKNNPDEGPSSFSAHSTLAIDFLHKVANAEHSTVSGSEISELTDSLDHSSAHRLATNLPPIQVAVAAIRQAQDACDLTLTVINQLLYGQSLSDICLSVYFSQDHSTADFIIVNAALHVLLKDFTFMTEAGSQDPCCEEYRLMCQRNIETALSKLSLYIGATHNMVLALVLGAMYEVDTSRPSLAWTLASAAYQASYSLGYHTRAHGSDPSSDVPNQSGLLFWAIYYLEKHLCLRLGRASVISDAEITVPLPGGNRTAMSPAMSQCRIIVKTGSLIGRIYDELYSPQTSFYSRELRMQKVLSISQELIVARVESRKVYQAWIKSRADEGLPGASIIALMGKIDEVFWWSLLTLVYRAVPAHPDDSMSYANDCIECARAALAAHQSFASMDQASTMLPLSSYMNWTIISSPFVPFLVLFCNAIEHENVDDLGALQDFVNSIESIGSCSAPIAKYHKLFRVFHDVAERYIEMKKANTPSQQGHTELQTEMDQCLGALGLQPYDSLQHGFDDGSILSPLCMPMQSIQGHDTEIVRGLEQPVQISNWYALSQQMIDSFNDDDQLSL